MTNGPYGGMTVDGHLDGVDIHMETAARYYDVSPNDVTPEQRQMGKELNWVGLYGHDIKRVQDYIMDDPLRSVPCVRTTEEFRLKAISRLDGSYEAKIIELIGRETEFGNTDTENNHKDADNILCNIVGTFGFVKTVAAFKKLDKWYA